MALDNDTKICKLAFIINLVTQFKGDYSVISCNNGGKKTKITKLVNIKTEMLFVKF